MPDRAFRPLIRPCGSIWLGAAGAGATRGSLTWPPSWAFGKRQQRVGLEIVSAGFQIFAAIISRHRHPLAAPDDLREKLPGAAFDLLDRLLLALLPARSVGVGAADAANSLMRNPAKAPGDATDGLRMRHNDPHESRMFASQGYSRSHDCQPWGGRAVPAF